MNRVWARSTLIAILALGLQLSCGGPQSNAGQIAEPATEGDGLSNALERDALMLLRVATFNVALNRPLAGELDQELLTGESAQARALAEIVQRVRPHILLLQEFDHHGETTGLDAFREKYLAQGQGGAQPISYPYAFMPLSNTGQPSGHDLDGDGQSDGPGDALGYGAHPGQYAFVLLSQFPLVTTEIRSFRNFLWRDMPKARLPKSPEDPSKSWYDDGALDALPLSSKNHVDVPVQVGDHVVHVIAAHPTPPVFDGPENRNGLRNFDEIRLLVDYIDPDRSAYLVDDQGRRGGLNPNQKFVILGDLNADPESGDAEPGAIEQLLNHPLVDHEVASGAMMPISGGALTAQARAGRTEKAPLTARWGLRVDYVLPSADLQVAKSGVFWPAAGEEGHHLMSYTEGKDLSSDHRLVWVDLTLSTR